MLTGPTNLQCPVCGHVFMSVQSRADGQEACAHCSFIGPRPHFRTLSQPLNAQPVRFQKRTPRLQPEPPPQVQSTPASPYPQTQQPYAQQPYIPQQPAAPPAPQWTATPASHPPTTQPFAHQPLGSPAAHPLWPGLGATGTPDTRPAAWQPPEEQAAIMPQKKSRAGFWITLVLASVCTIGVTALLAREKIRQRIRSLGGAQSTQPVKMPRTLPPPATRVNLMDQLNQRVITSNAMTDAEALMKTLFNSATTEERLKAIADREQYAADVAAMFDGGSPPPSLVMLTPITNPPLSLVTQERMPMFRVVTTANKAGALLSLTTNPEGRRLISWPLFHETHDRLLTRYVETKERDPKWFHVGLRRYHSFELPEPARSEFDAIDIDGSTDGSGHIVTFVAKESPLGRQFAKMLEWETFYFGRVLVSWMQIAGESRPALLDYEGSMLPAKKP